MGVAHYYLVSWALHYLSVACFKVSCCRRQRRYQTSMQNVLTTAPDGSAWANRFLQNILSHWPSSSTSSPDELLEESVRSQFSGTAPSRRADTYYGLKEKKHLSKKLGKYEYEKEKAESLPEQKADKIHYNQAKREQDWQNQQNKLRAKSLKEKAKIAAKSGVYQQPANVGYAETKYRLKDAQQQLKEQKERLKKASKDSEKIAEAEFKSRKKQAKYEAKIQRLEAENASSPTAKVDSVRGMNHAFSVGSTKWMVQIF